MRGSEAVRCAAAGRPPPPSRVCAVAPPAGVRRKACGTAAAYRQAGPLAWRRALPPARPLSVTRTTRDSKARRVARGAARGGAQGACSSVSRASRLVAPALLEACALRRIPTTVAVCVRRHHHIVIPVLYVAQVCLRDSRVERERTINSTSTASDSPLPLHFDDKIATGDR